MKVRKSIMIDENLVKVLDDYALELSERNGFTVSFSQVCQSLLSDSVNRAKAGKGVIDDGKKECCN